MHRSHNHSIRQFLWIALAVLGVGTGLVYFFFNASARSSFSKVHLRDYDKLAWAERALASSDENSVCLQDKLKSKELLEAEIGALEKTWSLQKFTNAWNGTDWQNLSATEAFFLKVYGSYLQTDGKDFQNCTTLPCIFDTVLGGYDKAVDGTEGLKLYSFFLSTGYALGLNKNIPLSKSELKNLENSTPEEMLFSPQDISAFWRISHLLTPAWTFMPTLQTFHHIPQTAVISGVNRESGSQSIRTSILMAERFQGRGPTDNSIQSIYYKRIFHELAHKLDQSEGVIPPQTGSSVSLSEEWKNFSGWKLQTVSDTNTGRVYYKWIPDTLADNDGFVTEYAKKNDPTEDWADSVAFFRIFADKAIQEIPKKSEFLKKRIFEGRAFDSAGKRTWYEQTIASNIEASFLQNYKNCLADTSTEACAQTFLENSIEQTISALKQTDYEFCDFISSTEAVSSLKKKGEEVFLVQKKTVDSAIATEPGSLEVAVDFQKTLKESIDPRLVYLSCRDNESPENCYSKTLETTIEDIFSNYKNSKTDTLLILEKARFVKEAPFYKTRSQAEQLLRKVIFLSVQHHVPQQADQRWEECKNSDYVANQKPITSPFTGNPYILTTAVLNCINSHIDSDLNEILSKNRQATKLKWESEFLEKTLKAALEPRYISALSKPIPSLYAEENKKIEANEALLSDSLFKSIMETKSIKLDANSDDIAIQCNDRIFSIADSNLALNKPKTGFSQIFSQSEALVSLLDGVCEKIKTGAKKEADSQNQLVLDYKKNLLLDPDLKKLLLNKENYEIDNIIKKYSNEKFEAFRTNNTKNNECVDCFYPIKIKLEEMQKNLILEIKYKVYSERTKWNSFISDLKDELYLSLKDAPEKTDYGKCSDKVDVRAQKAVEDFRNSKDYSEDYYSLNTKERIHGMFLDVCGNFNSLKELEANILRNRAFRLAKRGKLQKVSAAYYDSECEKLANGFLPQMWTQKEFAYIDPSKFYISFYACYYRSKEWETYGPKLTETVKNAVESDLSWARSFVSNEEARKACVEKIKEVIPENVSLHFMLHFPVEFQAEEFAISFCDPHLEARKKELLQVEPTVLAAIKKKGTNPGDYKNKNDFIEGCQKDLEAISTEVDSKTDFKYVRLKQYLTSSYYSSVCSKRLQAWEDSIPQFKKDAEQNMHTNSEWFTSSYSNTSAKENCRTQMHSSATLTQTNKKNIAKDFFDHYLIEKVNLFLERTLCDPALNAREQAITEVEIQKQGIVDSTEEALNTDKIFKTIYSKAKTKEQRLDACLKFSVPVLNKKIETTFKNSESLKNSKYLKIKTVAKAWELPFCDRFLRKHKN